MLNWLNDPRRELMAADLLALAEGLTIALLHIPEPDLGRLQALAWKLTTLSMPRAGHEAQGKGSGTALNIGSGQYL
jgi:hypothetical protein